MASARIQTTVADAANVTPVTGAIRQRSDGFVE